MGAVVEDVMRVRFVADGVDTLAGGFGTVGRAARMYLGILGDADRKTVAFGASALGLGVIMGELEKSSSAAGRQRSALVRTVGNFKGQFSSREALDYADSLRELTGVSTNANLDMLGLLGTFQLTKKEAMQLAPALLNSAEALKAQGISMNQVAVQAGKAIETGNATALRRAGINIQNPEAFRQADQAGRVRIVEDALQRQGGDAAIRFRQTMEGAQQAVVSGFERIQTSIGDGLTRPLTSVLNLTDRVENAFLKVDKATSGGLGRGVGDVLGSMVPVLAAVTVKSGLAAIETRALSAENVKLTNSALKASSALEEEGTMAGRLASRMTGARGGGGAAGMGAFMVGGTAVGAAGAGKLGAAETALLAAAGRLPAGARSGFRFGPMQAIGATMLAETALQAVPDEGGAGTFKRIAEGAVSGGLGGSLFGPWGAAAGALLGGGVGYFQDSQIKDAEKKNKPGDNSKMEELMAENNSLLRQLASQGRFGPPLDVKKMPGSLQWDAEYGRA